jgi:hypothetical protein
MIFACESTELTDAPDSNTEFLQVLKVCAGGARINHPRIVLGSFIWIVA